MAHTEVNFVLKEMGFWIARKHADKLCNITRASLLGGAAGHTGAAAQPHSLALLGPSHGVR